MRKHHLRLPFRTAGKLASLLVLGLIAAGCQSTGGGEARVHQFDPLEDTPVGAEDLAAVEPKTLDELLAEAEAAFDRANEAQESGDYEAALRNYNYMLELIIQADLDPAVFYNLRSEFDDILDTSTKTAHLYDRGRIREWTDDDFKRLAGISDLPIPSPLPKRVLDEIDKIQNVYPKNFQRGLDRSFLYMPHVRAEFAKHGLPQDLVWLAMVESQFHPRATSRVGAGGMWQFMRSTGRLYKLRIDGEIDERYDWERATQASATHLRDLYAQFNSWPLAVSAYNRGPGGIERDIARGGGDRNWWRLIDSPETAKHIPTETKEFYPKLLASIIVAKNPEKYGFKLNPSQPLQVAKERVKGSYRLSDLDKALDLRSGTLAELNPHLVNKRTLSSGETELVIPAADRTKFASAIKSVKPYSATVYASGGAYTVRRGDTLSEIAARYRTSVKSLMAANNIKSARSLRSGQRLVVPGSGSSSSSTAAASGGVYTVRSGDTLSEIASKHKVKVADLQQWNSMGRSTRLRVGQKLKVGATASVEEPTVTADTRSGEAIIHTVTTGEYPAKIASRYGVKTDDLLGWNSLSKRSTIRVGQKLKVYAPQASAPQETEVAKASPSARAATNTSNSITHTVAKGESASVIASKYGVRTSDFLAWNGLNKRSVLRVGDKYVIKKSGGASTASATAETVPASAKRTHTVSRGESAWTIARKYKVAMDDLFEWNGWTKTPVLKIGTKVTIYSQ